MSADFTIQLQTNMTEMMDAWQRARELIPAGVRATLAEAIFPDKEMTRAELSRTISLVMKNLFMGNIPPVIEPTLRKWVELQMLNIHMMHADQGTPQLAGRDINVIVGDVLEAVQRSSQRPARQFLAAPPLEIAETPELELVEAKRG